MKLRYVGRININSILICTLITLCIGQAVGQARFVSKVKWCDNDNGIDVEQTGEWARFFFADVNGDKRADLVVLRDDGIYVGLSTGTSFGPRTMWSTNWGSLWGSKWPNHKYVTDVTGDGKADFVDYREGGIFVQVSNGSSFSSEIKFADARYPVPSDQLAFADFNGDGKTDYIYVDTRWETWVGISTGSSFENLVDWGGNWAWDTFADVNADGKADMIQYRNFYGSNDDSQVAAFINNGSFAGSSTLLLKSFATDKPRSVSDFSGDARADALSRHDDGDRNGYVAVNNGYPFDPYKQWSPSDGDFANFYVNLCYYADVTGDGRTDVIALYNDGVFVQRIVPDCNLEMTIVTKAQLLKSVRAFAKLTTSGSLVLDAQQRASMEASVSVTLKPGFTASSGSVFVAKIESYECGAIEIGGNGLTADTNSTMSSLDPGITMPKGVEILAYPNPTNGNFVVYYSPSLSQGGQLKLIDSFSNTIYSQTVNVGESETNLNLGNLKKGIYYLRVISGAKELATRISVE